MLIFRTLILFFISNFALAQANDGFWIMEKNSDQRKVADETVDILMVIKNKKGDKRERKITLTTLTNDEDLQKSLISFSSPKNVKGTGLLTYENLDSEDDQWLYLPALKRTRRISAADQTDNFMGTDFTFEDLSTENLKDFEYKIISKESLDGIEAYQIEAIPANEKAKKESGYARRVLWIGHSDFVIRKVEFYDSKSQLIKMLSAKDIREVAPGVWRAKEVTMKDLKTQHSTTLLYKQFLVNKGLSENQFTMRSLERGI